MSIFSIIVDYDTETTEGKKIRARSTYQIEAQNLPHAYKKAKRALENNGYEKFKLGACINGAHLMI